MQEWQSRCCLGLTCQHFEDRVSSGYGSEALLRVDEPFITRVTCIHLGFGSFGRGVLTFQAAVNMMRGLSPPIFAHKRKISSSSFSMLE